MIVRVALGALVLVVSGCERAAPGGSAGQGAPAQIEAPAENDSARVFAAANEAATAATGELSVSITVRMPDPRGGQDAQETLSLRGANGFALEAVISNVVSPATQVQGQTLRALLDIAVEEPRVIVYRVTGETRVRGRGLCGADAPAYVVVWEPAGPGLPAMKLMGVAGEAPGAAGARACAMLEYRRA